MEKKEQVMSIMKDLEDKAITKYQATELILILFGVVRSFPSDDEIEKVADDKIYVSTENESKSEIYADGFIDGAKWIKEKIANS